MPEHHLPGHGAMTALHHVMRPLEVETARVDAVVTHQEMVAQLALDVALRGMRLGDVTALLAAALDEKRDHRRALDPRPARRHPVDEGAVRRRLGNEIDALEVLTREPEPIQHGEKTLGVRTGEAED